MEVIIVPDDNLRDALDKLYVGLFDNGCRAVKSFADRSKFGLAHVFL